MFQLLGKMNASRVGVTESMPPTELSSEVRRYVSASYPHNHTFTVNGTELLPKWKLRARSRSIMSLYPRPVTSLIDLSCCKGYFVFEAGKRATCERAMGVDVFERDVDVCHALQRHTRSDNTIFECMKLDEVSDRVEEFGGAFQTALLINSYQYLYFGSERGAGYLDHGAIFRHLARVCGRCVVFSNRTELKDCQNSAQIAKSGTQASQYCTDAIMGAAAEHFTVFPVSTIGRYPLWLLVRR